MGKPPVKQIEVPLGDRSYSVTLGAGLLKHAGEHLAPYARAGRLVVVTDDNVWAALGPTLASALDRAGIEPVPVIVAAGEASKSWPVLIGLTDRLLELGVERGDHIIAFGGGMVGDLTGFAAAITKRGCSYVQVPTSLLAQVDSSVGGKTGINSSAGKNMVGAFHQPSAVFIDPDTLGTLPERELRAGYAEVVKYGLIGDARFFEWCETHGSSLLSGDAEARLHAIETSIRAKAVIVAQDERETKGHRALLNFGHSFAHALEAETGYSSKLLHGEAVAIGMVLAFRFSMERGFCAEGDADRVAAHLKGVGLPTDLRAAGVKDTKALTSHLANDKKNVGGRRTLILTTGIGSAFVDSNVELDEVEQFLRRQLA